MKSTFEVDKRGLAKILERRGGKAFAVLELIQNSWDEEGVTEVKVALVSVGPGRFTLVVEDDAPEGFRDLAHAYTLFAESEKKKNPVQRGRFNLGEKLVIAVCYEATIQTTKGTVYFTEDGRVEGDAKTDRGSTFTGVLRMTKAEADKVAEAVRRVLPPRSIRTTFNGEALEPRDPVLTFTAALETEIGDEDGNLRRTERKAEVSLYEPREGEKATVYELGLPIRAIGDRWHVDVGQKVPLTIDRENVRPSFLRELRVAVLNEASTFLSGDDADATWVSQALESDKAKPNAVNDIITKRFGEKRVINDPSDPEGTKMAMAQGFTVIPPRAMSRAAWDNVRKFDLARPAGKVTPSPKVYGEKGGPASFLPEEEWTPAMRSVVTYSKRLAERLLLHPIDVLIVNDPEARGFSAAYGHGQLQFNLTRLGRRWFENAIVPSMDEPDVRHGEAGIDLVELLIHEFAHDSVSDHLSSRFADEVATLGVRLARHARRFPDVFSIPEEVTA